MLVDGMKGDGVLGLEIAANKGQFMLQSGPENPSPLYIFVMPILGLKPV
jgi:hypothetical protein